MNFGGSFHAVTQLSTVEKEFPPDIFQCEIGQPNQTFSM